MILLKLTFGLISFMDDSTVACTLLEVFLAIGALYTVWRCWAFTVLPMLQPFEPPELPYCIPSK